MERQWTQGEIDFCREIDDWIISECMKKEYDMTVTAALPNTSEIYNFTCKECQKNTAGNRALWLSGLCLPCTNSTYHSSTPLGMLGGVVPEDVKVEINGTYKRMVSDVGTSDPTGKDQHAPGAKLDNGKPRVGLVMQGFPRALMAVAEVSTFGANKYTEGGWKTVPNGVSRYTDALGRHMVLSGQEDRDPDSELLHLAHLAWNALAVLELTLQGKK